MNAEDRPAALAITERYDGDDALELLQMIGLADYEGHAPLEAASRGYYKPVTRKATPRLAVNR